MVNQIPVKRVFFHVLRGNKYAFADERTRQYLIRITEEISRESNWQIYAFCMTGEDAYFIIEAKSLAELNRDLARIMKRFAAVCQELLPGWWSELIRLHAGRARRLMSEQEIKQYCCFLHKLPLRFGYAEQLADYWWSSYVTYAGIYDWKIVNCEWLLAQFSDQPARARQKLKEYHRTAEISFDIDND